jgi:protein PhnA
MPTAQIPMPHTIPACPQCGLENTYPDGSNYVCPDCAFEWPQAEVPADDDAQGDGIVRDAHGQALADGDSVILVKDLKVKGSSSVLKKGSKIKSIRLVDGVDGHNVDCKTELGSMLLKSEFLKKA